MNRLIKLGTMIVGLATLATSVAAHAQAGRAQAKPPADSVPDDIIVEGYRDRPDLGTKVTPPASISATRNRQAYEHSEHIAKCAARSKLSDLSRLRAVVDGEFGTAVQVQAQDRLKRVYVSCSEGAWLLHIKEAPQSDMTKAAIFDTAKVAVQGIVSNDAPFSGDPAPLGHSIYDRGAFTVQALKLFAPDVKLTRADTNSPAVQSRFNLREVPRNRFRPPEDYRYFEVAVCMVRVEPKLAVRLAMSDGSARFDDVQAALIDRARVCVGGARNVSVDPTQFRLYIADAVYRWAVAARGVDSLIPEGRG